RFRNHRLTKVCFLKLTAERALGRTTSTRGRNKERGAQRRTRLHGTATRSSKPQHACERSQLHHRSAVSCTYVGILTPRRTSACFQVPLWSFLPSLDAPVTTLSY
ncbi:unnamed protein product, partial [Ectocarpus fasciculatus]